jgi:hypothetical protein
MGWDVHVELTDTSVLRRLEDDDAADGFAVRQGIEPGIDV